jgi:microcystin-dependent protein
MPFIGEIRIFAGNFAPVGWEFCREEHLCIPEQVPPVILINWLKQGERRW